MKKWANYGVLTFLLWVVSPIVLTAVVSLVNRLLIDFRFMLFNLLIPGMVLGILAMLTTNIKRKDLRVATFYSIIGFVIWFSPAIYFLTASPYYLALNNPLQALS